MTYEPPTVREGSVIRGESVLAKGVVGYACRHGGRIYIPVMRALREGNGDVGRFLDSLSVRCVIPNVINNRLRGMLERRCWKRTMEIDETFGEAVEVWVRGPVTA